MRLIAITCVTLLGACATTTDPEEPRRLPEGWEVAVRATVEAQSSGRTGGDLVGRSLSEFDLGLDLERAVGIDGLTVGLQARGSEGSPSEQPSLGGVSSLEEDPNQQIAQLFVAAESRQLSWRLGVLDANERFAALEGAEGFVSPAPGTSPAIAAMPTAPEGAPGAEVQLSGRSIEVAVGLYDGGNRAPLRAEERPEGTGLFAIAEVGIPFEDDGASRALVGAFHDSGSEGAESGAYVGADVELWRDRPGEKALRAFCLYGANSGSTAEIERHAIIGAAFSGPFGRSGDSVGLMSSFTAASAGGGEELSTELFYRLALSESVAMTASAIQLEALGGSGGGSGTVDDLVVGFRFEYSF